MSVRRRRPAQYQNLSIKYIIGKKDLEAECFHRQYYHVYRARIKLLRNRIIDNAKLLLGDDIEPCRLTKAKKGDEVLVIGTIAKRVKLRPSVLRDLAEEQLILPQPVAEDKLIGEEDFVEFEDDDQIVRLSGDFVMDEVATGCVVGIYGRQLDNDIFQVIKIIWPSKAPQPTYPVLNDDRYIAFVSGFSFTGQADAEKIFSLDLLQKWLCGLLPLFEKERDIVERTVRLVVAGESVAITEQGREFTTAARYLIKNEECPNVECVAHMDKFLSKISNLLEVDVMPGLGDPSTYLMPQQPIHRAVFVMGSKYGRMLNLVTNPYEFSVEGVHILGTSGECLSDLKRFTKTLSGVELLSKVLDWQHLAPTIPDTVDGFPFIDRDPFIIESFPHILFAANQPEASHALVEFEGNRRTLLLSVPSFTKTFSMVLVNLRNLEVIEHNFFVDRLICDI
ncbi:pold2-prov protein, putative [Brugia malayi]|uniref:Bm13974 n=3 Tax=Brugia TaxID=6278 RepID=A0A0H5SJP1_BRUMA|nr:pold2-prov protein, putative [Brugia malayi]CRZ24031.1 Bm13974 [Brugia malayi]VIO92677.1 pold2-prov protein, putative [Brugia malayi]